MRNPRALVIFDLDGTLVDSNLQIATNLNRARSELSFEILSLEFYEKNIGLPVDALISDLNLEPIQRQILISKFREYLLQDIESGNNVLFPGVKQALSSLSSNKIEIALATNKPTEIATRVLTHSCLSEYKIHVQGVDGLLPKPSPEIVQAVLKVFPNRIPVLVGDRVEDMVAAKSAGVPGIGIASGAHTEDVLRRAGAFSTFQSFESFSKHLCTNTHSFFEFPE
jgi:phosphoglycolate phosphatase